MRQEGRGEELGVARRPGQVEALAGPSSSGQKRTACQ